MEKLENCLSTEFSTKTYLHVVITSFFYSFFSFCFFLLIVVVIPSHLHKHIRDLLKKLVYKKITFIRPTSPACLHYTMPIYFIDITYVHFELK